MLSQVRPEIVLALIALAVVAILLSIALSIRCAMTKCYFGEGFRIFFVLIFPNIITLINSFNIVRS